MKSITAKDTKKAQRTQRKKVTQSCTEVTQTLSAVALAKAELHRGRKESM